MKHTIAACVAISLFSTLSYAQETWTPSALCPYPSEDLTRTPYEGDCTKYWECFEGARYIMTCPNGLEYNENAAQCDNPATAGCDREATYTYPTYPHTLDPSASTSTPFTPNPMCPYPSDVLTFYPYPLNCSQYWECFQGNRYLMDCPTNLYWNVDYDYCDYLENVDCNKNLATTTTSTTAAPTNATTPGTVTNATTQATLTTTGSTVWTPDPLCPYPSEDIKFYPHDTNCTQYWECFEGDRYLMSCPIGLYWNDLANICDYLANVDCDRTHATTTTTPITTPSTASPTNGTTGPPTTTTPPPTTPAVTCLNTADGTYFRDPFDCSKYYECVGGKGIAMQCPGVLYWNEVKLTCDYPENVNCVTF